MHEMSLIAGVFEAIDSALTAHQYDRVIKVKLQVGKFTNAIPSALQFAFEAFAKDTKVEGAELEIVETAVVGYCQACNNEFAVEGLTFRCPLCQDHRIEITSGKELILESLEVE